MNYQCGANVAKAGYQTVFIKWRPETRNAYMKIIRSFVHRINNWVRNRGSFFNTAKTSKKVYKLNQQISTFAFINFSIIFLWSVCIDISAMTHCWFINAHRPQKYLGIDSVLNKGVSIINIDGDQLIDVCHHFESKSPGMKELTVCYADSDWEFL